MVNIELSHPSCVLVMAALPEWRFFNRLQKELIGKGAHAIVSGSVPLRLYIDCVGQSAKYPLFVPNDTDIFIGCTNAGLSLAMLFNIVAEFGSSNPDLKINGFEAVPAPYGDYRGLVPICFLLNFRLARRGTNDWSTIQLIVMEKPSDIRTNEQWGLNVVEHFDITICRVAICNATQLTRFTFLHRSDSYAICEGVFDVAFTASQVPATFARMAKYIARGFRLKGLEFATLGTLRFEKDEIKVTLLDM